MGEGMQGSKYQLQPSHVGTIHEVLQAIHVLIDETEGVCPSRVHPHKRYYVHAFVVKEGPHVNLVVKPLWDVNSVPLSIDRNCNILRRLERRQTRHSNGRP